MAALVSVSLIFLGCPTESDDSPGYSPEQAAAELAAVLGADKATVSGATVTLIDNVNIPAALTVTVGNGVTLDVASAKTLTVDGVIDNNGEISVSGTYIIPAPTGDITSRGSNNGKVTVKSGGDLQSYGDAIAGEGETVVETGGKVAWGKDDNGATVYSAGPSSASPKRFVLSAAEGDKAGGYLVYGNTFYRIGGSVSFNASWSGAGYDVIDLHNESFTIEAGTFTIPSSAGFRVKNSKYEDTDNDGNLDEIPDTTNVRTIEGEAGATIAVEGKLYLEIGSVTLNFYTSTGTVVTTTTTGSSATYVGYNTIPAGTYKWETFTPTSGQETTGWKAQAAGG
jgi:hypothetical protein